MAGRYPLAFTVFTATYNRAHTLHRVFDSLCAQTYRDFEWLVVDDGSTDHTPDLIAEYARRADFPVRYVRQANGGQHIACNRGVVRARGFLFAMVDSDDGCVPTALERFQHHWQTIPPAERERFFGVGGLCCDEHGRLIGTRFPCDVWDTTLPEMWFRYRVKGQKWWCVRTEVLRRYPWADTRGKAPNPWTRLGRHYRIRLVNEVLKVFYQDDPEGSLSRSRRTLRPEPNLWRQVELLNGYADWVAWHPVRFLQAAVHYTRCSLHLRRGLDEQWHALTNPAARALWLAALLPGTAWYLRDRRSLKILR